MEIKKFIKKILLSSVFSFLANQNKLSAKRSLFLLLLSFSLFHSSIAQPPGIEWQKTIGGSSDDIPTTSIQTSDGGYLIGGISMSGITGDKSESNRGTGTNDYWIVKLSKSGAIEWQKTIGGDLDDNLSSVSTTEDGGYIIGGSSNSSASYDKSDNSLGDYDFWILKLNSSGSIQWQKTIGGNHNDMLQSIKQTKDKGYVIGGITTSDFSSRRGTTDNDYWVIKLDKNGSIEWEKIIGGTSNDMLRTLEMTNDKDMGYILGGSSNSGISGDKTEASRGIYGDYDYWIVKLDSHGKIKWDKTVGGNAQEFLGSLKQTQDSGYILVGNSSSDASGDKTQTSKCYYGNLDYWIVKLDSDGVIKWQSTIGGCSLDYGTEVIQLKDKGYIIGGSSYSGISGDKSEDSRGSSDFWILKIDRLGNIKWQKTIGGSKPDVLYDLIATNEYDILLSGYSSSGSTGDKSESNKGLKDYWIVKLGCNAPTAICKNISVTLNSSGTATISASDIYDGSVTYCGLKSMTISRSSFTCNDIGNNNVVLTVTDINDNVSTCNATVTIVGSKPTCSITSSANNSGYVIVDTYTEAATNQMFLGYGAQSMNLFCSASGGSSFTYSWTGTGLSSTSVSDPVFKPTNPGNYTLSCTVTNDYGCQTSCEIVICVIDARGKDNSENNPQVAICHLPVGGSKSPQSMSVNPNSVAAHLVLHDGCKLGTCESSCETNKSYKRIIENNTTDAYKTSQFFELLVYPNPSKKSFNFILSSNDESNIDMIISEISGRVISSVKDLKPNEEVSFGSELAAGIYYITVQQGQLKETRKLIKIGQ